MRIYKYYFMRLFLFILLLITGCTSFPSLQYPDIERFEQTVASETLRDSLNNGKILGGMPYYLVSKIFEKWTPNISDIKRPVASLGSKQRLEEIEGWGRDYTDPHIQIYLDEYEMEKGKLTVWYQKPDFFRMDVSSNDTLYIFLPDTIVYSTIKCLNNFKTLTVRDSLKQIPRKTNLYAQIRYKDHPWRTVSHWYTLQLIGKSFQTFTIKKLNYEIYPVELLEFNDEPINSFKWGK